MDVLDKSFRRSSSHQMREYVLEDWSVIPPGALRCVEAFLAAY